MTFAVVPASGTMRSRPRRPSSSSLRSESILRQGLEGPQGERLTPGGSDVTQIHPMLRRRPPVPLDGLQRRGEGREVDG